MHSILQRNHSPKTPADNDFSARYKLENQPVVSGRFQDVQHASLCEFTLRPTLDLFVFSLEHFRAIGVHGCDIRLHDDFIGRRDFRNIGLEFDPHWGDIYWRSSTLRAEDEKILEYFAEAGVYELEESTIYLIDYSIHCNQTILRWEHETGKDATAFIARDGRFVCLSYPGQYDIGTGDDDRDIYRGSSFSFADTLREKIESMVAARYESEWEDEAPYHERTASIEVLAWIPSTADPRCQKVIELF